MKQSKRIRKWLGIAVCYLLALLAGALGWCYSLVPEQLPAVQGQAVSLPQLPFLSLYSAQGGQMWPASQIETTSGNMQVRLFGVLPVRTIWVSAAARPNVVVSGRPFGIKLLSDGALVVGFASVNTDTGKHNPAKEAGLQLGDLIVSVDGQTVHSNEELAAALNRGQGQAATVVFIRDGVSHSTRLAPIWDEGQGSWRAGMWVRDSSAGVGTLTFLLPENGAFAGLGHAISDADTGLPVALLSGEIMDCEIVNYIPGTSGRPGELKGHFVGSQAIGSVEQNAKNGIYGKIWNWETQPLTPVAMPQEVHTGAAQILTTIEGSTPRYYAVEIEKVTLNGEDHNLLLRVTDEDLLQTTGGILQGMSGSPILQDGMLVGAVTHVMVKDPTCGYGVFASAMLEQAQSLSAAQKAA